MDAMITLKRRSYEKGHKRKLLVVIDGTSECERALYFAIRRAEHTGSGLILLHVIAPADFQHWLNVKSIIREEAMEAARSVLRRCVDMARERAGIEAESVLREGTRSEEIIKLIENDEDIVILVLAAAHDGDGPGPLISFLVNDSSNRCPIPITIVPGGLTEGQIDELA